MNTISAAELNVVQITYTFSSLIIYYLSKITVEVFSSTIDTENF